MRLLATIGTGGKAKEGSLACGVDRLEIFTQQQPKWPPTEADFAKIGMQGCLTQLPHRAAEIVFFFASIKSRELPGADAPEFIIDLTKSLKWLVGQTRHSPLGCLASSSRPWFLDAGRAMTGVEAMMFQGWPLNEFVASAVPSQIVPWPDSLLLHIAGNAMNSLVLCDLFTNIFTHVDWVHALETYEAWCVPLRPAVALEEAAHDVHTQSVAKDDDAESSKAPKDDEFDCVDCAEVVM